MIHIDGSRGEGGGQILRTALSLGAITGQAVRIERIRANRRQPGLRPQHVTALRASAAVCGAQVEGGAVGSHTVVFEPRHPPQAGDHTFDVRDATTAGSAGSATLVLQTLLLPLAFAAGRSELTLRGGTHVAWSPPFHYLQHVYLPCLRRLGLSVQVALQRWGWYPRGGGEITAEVTGGDDPAATDTQPPSATFQLQKRGDLRRIRGISATSRLPEHIRNRMRLRAIERLRPAGVRVEIDLVDAPSPGPGAGLFLFAEYSAAGGHSVAAGFSGFGRRGKSAEVVADEAARSFLAHHRSGAPVDPYLADQLILPLTLFGCESRFRTSQITRHLLANADVVEAFVRTRVTIEGREGSPGTVSVTPRQLSD